MIKALYYDFGEIDVFNNFVIAIMKEGVTVIPEHNKHLVEIANTYFSNRPFGYITYRKNSYAVDPMVYLKTSEINNLVAFAIVAEDSQKISNIEIEKLFLKKPLRSFTNLDDAKDWVNELIKNNEF